uniref:MMS1_N domain-containing protein n=1 Tax=Elaeophora elaphi TaxID=1147741 RepID=A0A0R3RIJ6_9BILA
MGGGRTVVARVMDILLDSLTAEISETLLIDNYTSHGLIVFDGATLSFIAGVYSGTDGKAYYNRQIAIMFSTLEVFPKLLDGWCNNAFQKKEDPSASCQFKLSIDPPLPLDEKFRAMLVNRNGSRVALASAHSVFVVELPCDCWCRQSVTQNPLMDHLQSTYHCKYSLLPFAKLFSLLERNSYVAMFFIVGCNRLKILIGVWIGCDLKLRFFAQTGSRFVGSHIRLADTAIDILKIRWCWKGRHKSGHHAYNRLAILHSGNFIKIYDTDINYTIPAIMIDFKSLLGVNESGFGHSLGVHNYIASFDFGPSFVRVDNDSGAEINLETLFAIDNDCGDIYIVVYSDNRVIEIQGPLALTGTVPGDSTCSGAFDMLYIQYHEKTLLPIFSLISSNACVMHFLALTLDKETFDGHMEFILVSYDNILLSCKPLADISYCLQNDPVQSGQYFVICGANLFSIDINPWANLLSNLLLTNASRGKNTSDLPDSKIHHVFAILGSTETKGVADAITFATTVCVTNDKSLMSDDVYKAFDEKDIVYIALTSSIQLLHKFKRQDTIWHDKRAIVRRHDVPIEGRTQDYLLEECLKILQSQTVVPNLRLNKSVTEAEAIEVASGVVQALVENMRVTQVAFRRIQDIITEDMKSLKTINNNKSTCTERLLRVLSAYVDLRNRIYKIQRAVAQLKKRSDELGSGLVPKMFPLTDSEKALKDKLDTLRVEVDGITRQLPHLASEVAAKRRDRFGPVRSFSASMSAQKFMLSKNTEDVNEMVSWTKQLIKKIDSIQASIATEEALSSSPKPISQ